jgi:aryl-alcohol dehydrogenase-like predicted oxidoreductase
LQAEGKIKHVGVSNFGVKQLTAALATGVTIVSNQLCYNLLTRAIEFDLADLCAKHNIGIICYSPLLQGLLTDKGVALTSLDTVDKMRLRTYHFDGKREKSRHGGPGHEALVLETLEKIKAIAVDARMPVPVLATAWCLMHPAVVSVIPGASSRKQLESNMLAAQPLPAAVKQALDDASDALKQAIGNLLDIYEGADGQRSF